MKNRYVRALGIIAALAVPMSGLTLLNGSTAGASTSSYKVTPSFVFLTQGYRSTVNCTATTVTFTATSSTGTHQADCAGNSTGYHYFTPFTYFTTLTLSPGSLRFETAGSALVLSTAHFKLTFGSLGTCTFTFKTVRLTQTRHKIRYNSTNLSTATFATVTGAAGICGTLRTLFGQPTDSFDATIVAT